MGEFKFEKWMFKDESLKIEAITHKSFASENPADGPHNERLEWIGDTIITTVVSDYLFFRFPYHKEGALTKLRSKIVCKETLAKFARKLGLENDLRLGIGALKSGDRSNERLLEDTFEAYIGAVYLDSGRDLNEVNKFLEPIIKLFVDELAENEHNNNNGSPPRDSGPVYGPINKIIEPSDPNGMLQNWAQSRGFEIPDYKWATPERKDENNKPIFDCEVIIDGKVFGSGSSGKKKEARKKAAICALESFGIFNYNSSPI
ncbi:ribonuclease III domain-containing protein [Gigaspora rosea]|uniref:ribonuclease III n=1 Tax=Gigaspora rosea TaxID=44941 RepID=A0A397W670_9GLOM|nr:ribonuclease III domain-containing protein [Gigaspora rosea]